MLLTGEGSLPARLRLARVVGQGSEAPGAAH